MASVDGGDPTAIGRLQLATFANPAGLAPIGENVFAATPASGPATLGAPDAEGFGSLVPRTLERSNVDVGEEMVNMLTAQRSYQFSARMLQMADEMLAEARDIWR
ncbi:MAG: flagellar hook-basal body complex protein [Dehalococcoidales bacterium]|nr:flagellar hook-basal body complex protein [Dehalococcoidales bacterium]